MKFVWTFEIRNGFSELAEQIHSIVATDIDDALKKARQVLENDSMLSEDYEVAALSRGAELTNPDEKR